MMESKSTQSAKRVAHGAAFSEAYASLNAAQKKAVDTIDGPVLVVAGPGTGKTQILTLRIANILLRTDVGPDSILALTFTESGAKAMRERLRQYLGAAAYQVGIFTFHGFAQSLISQYPDAYPRIIGGRPATDLEQISLLEQILDSGVAPSLRPTGNPSYYVTPLMRMIGSLKQENISPDALATLIAEQEQSLTAVPRFHEKGAHKGKERGEYSKLVGQIDKNRNLLAVYRAYQAVLVERHLYDFNDMIIETVTALEQNESMLRDLQERYQYILADEHQDVNGAQNRILELLASYHAAPNIFAVGDEKQAIYRFQGASLENFLSFTTMFPDTTVVSLTENYRSGQCILDAAQALVAVDDGPLKKLRIPLTAALVESATVEVRDFPHQAIEDEYVVAAVQAALAAGVSPAEIAVIVRTNKDVEYFAGLLRQASICVSASAEGDVLRHPIMQQVRELMTAVAYPEDATALFALLHGAYWGIAADDLFRVLTAVSYERPLTAIIGSEALLCDCKVVDVPAVFRIHTVLMTAREKSVTMAPHHVVAYVLEASGLLAHVLSEDSLEGSRVVRRLYDEIEAMVVRDHASSLRTIVEQLKARDAYGLSLNAPVISVDTDVVQVLTAHKSKGLEFSTVIAPRLTDGGWNGAGKRTYFNIPLSHQVDAVSDVVEDERRLLYVLLTRAKRQLLLSWAEENSDGTALTASRFFEPLHAYTTTVDTVSYADTFSPAASLALPTVPVAINHELITAVLRERGFSATSFNNYRRSPWDYLYRNVLRIPQPQTLSLQFGTAIHNVLESCTRTHTISGTIPSDTEIKMLLERELGRLPLSVEDMSQLLEKGLNALVVYRQHLVDQLPTVTKEELKLTVLLPTGMPELPELPLTGKLDRIDMGSDGYATRVVDYKTGKPKSRNVIEGNTKGSDGDYKRQLTFYALLLSLYDDERYVTNEGVLSFVEPTAKGVIKEESFVITETEIAALRDELIAGAAEIVSGAPFAVLPTPEQSEYAALAARLLR